MFSFQGMDKREIVVALAGLYKRQVYVAAAVIVSVALLMKSALTGVGCGIVWSLLDTLLLVISILKGFNRMSEGELKFRVFMNFVKRLALALVMLYLAIRYNAGIVWMLIVFTLMHLVLVVNLLIFTGRKEQKKVS
jgi:hypothetical protein